MEYRHPAKAVAWLLVLFIFPILGFIMYYFVARQFKHRHRRSLRGNGKGSHLLGASQEEGGRRQANREGRDRSVIAGPELDPRLLGLLRNSPGPEMTGRNEVTILTNAEEAYEAILKAIEEAADHIHLDYYTIRNDGIGQRFQAALIAKARQGVEVRIIYDGIGSYELDEGYIQELREAGVQTGCFLPALIAFIDKRINYRNHRKIVVVDGRIGFLGGINIGDEYLGGNPKLGFWRDTHMRLYGDSVRSLQRTFMDDWEFVRGERLDSGRYFPEHHCHSIQWVQIVSGGPDGEEDAILSVTFAALGSARERIYIASPYFIPDSGIIQALKVAAMSGVDVRIILPGVPDTRIVYWASLSYVSELLQVGVRFYKYQKGFMHAKVILVDEILAAVGTANMDLRSFFKNFELNAILFERSTIRRLESDFLQDVEDSEEIIPAPFYNRPKLQKAKEVAARLLSPLF
ncbi:cardiolipin synthase 2 [Paenibacillus sp. J2TS4]|nr:cardiolipin synthase 2 [Paenibacillus sp. J2TS4]